MSITLLHATTYNDRNDRGFFRVLKENTYLTKRFSPAGSIPSSYPKKFRLGKFYDPSSLEELLPVLNNIAADPQTLAIRYKYRLAKEGDTVFRRGELVCPHPSYLICMDVDELPLPDNISNKDIKAQAEYVCGILHKCEPETFPDDMGFIAQGSSRAGMTEKVKLHIWIQNYWKLTQGQLRNVFTQINSTFKLWYEKENGNTPDFNLIDTALYHDAQAHYLAAPIFINMKNPLDGLDRTVFNYGNPCYIPEGVASFAKTVKVTEKEQNTFISSIDGSLTMSDAVQVKYDRVMNWEPTKSGLRTAVISLYHEAVQDCYNLDRLEKEIKHMLSLKRPGLADNYIKQGKASAVNAIKNNSMRTVPNEYENLPIKTISGGNQERFLDLQESVPDNSVTFLKASLGTGKTYSIENWLANGKVTGRFLALTDTSALVESNAARFDAGDFRTAKARLDFAIGKSDRLSGTLHSLPKIKELVRSFDFLFIDEADSLLNNLLFAKIITEERKAEIAEILCDLILHTNQVVLSDGDISEETVAQYIELIEGGRDFYRVEHHRQNLKGVKAYKHPTEASLWGAVQGSLELGERCLVVTDGSPDKLNTMCNVFSRVSPEKVVKTIHSVAKMDLDVKDIINNTNSALERQKVDALLCSPSVTNGVDFNYFDSVFVITTSENHTPNMRFQALMREREPDTIHYFFSNRKGYITGYKQGKVDKGWMDKARLSYALRREKECRTYIGTFNYYLIRAGATIEALTDPYDSPLEAEDKDAYENERILAVLNATHDKIIPRHNDAFDVQELIKYYYDLEELEYCDVSRFLSTRPDKCADFLNSIFEDFWDVIQLCSPVHLITALKEKGNKYYLATGKQARPNLFCAKAILKMCGISSTNDLSVTIDNYKKYCVYNNLKIPKAILDVEESAREIF